MANEEESSRQIFEAQTSITRQTLSFIKSSSLKCAIQLGIFDAIHRHGQPMTLSELASALHVKPEKSHGINSLLRVLVISGFIFVAPKEEEETTRFTLSPTSRLLLRDETCNLIQSVMVNNDPILRKPWDILSRWFSNDDASPFQTAHGRNFWEYNASEPSFGGPFNELAADDSKLVTTALVKECKEVFRGLTSLVDVGGGTGTVGKIIAREFSNLKCIVFDLPHVVANLERHENLSFVGGDMFDAIPSANAILLKWTLHNWNDEDCVRILKKCKEAIPSKEEGGKVIIIDIIMDSQEDDNELVETHTFFDMLMMVLLAGKERNRKEWSKIFSDAGFSDYKIIELGFKTLVEVYP